jgi:hypothetical protein
MTTERERDIESPHELMCTVPTRMSDTCVCV